MTKAIIFDLDSCLSAADEIGRDLYEPAFEAVRQANHGTVSEESLAAAFEESWRIPWDVISAKHGFSDEMRAAGWRVFASMKVARPMRGYPDLHVLGELAAMRFLVTSGFRRLQESKIDALGLRPLFTAVYVDAIDEPGLKGKQRIFEVILSTYHLLPFETLVVGDNEDSEIAAGHRLNMPTVQILRPGVSRGNLATYTVDGLFELKRIIGSKPAPR